MYFDRFSLNRRSDYLKLKKNPSKTNHCFGLSWYFLPFQTKLLLLVLDIFHPCNLVNSFNFYLQFTEKWFTKSICNNFSSVKMFVRPFSWSTGLTSSLYLLTVNIWCIRCSKPVKFSSHLIDKSLNLMLFLSFSYFFILNF